MTHGDQTLGAELLRELIRTPAVHELARNLLAGASSEAPAIADALLNEDPAVALDVLGRTPEAANAAARALCTMARTLERFPPLLAAELLQELTAKLDDEEMARARAACWSLLERLAGDEEALRVVARTVADAANGLLRRIARVESLDAPVRVGAAVVRELNFGLLRAAVESASQKLTRALVPEVEAAVSDVVLLSNLLAPLPHLANAGLSLAAVGVGGLRLPPEVLASALFNLLQELDTGALARLVNGLSSLVTGAHEGSMVLGQVEPRFREVLARLLHDLLLHVDRQAAARAVVALGEDLETVLLVTADQLHADRELAATALAAGLAALEAALRGAGAAAEKLNALPAKTTDELATLLARGLPGAGAARLLNAAAALARQLLEASPELHRNAVGSFLDEVDWPALLQLAQRLAAPALDLGPDRWGQLLGDALSAAARELARRPGAVRAAVARLDRPEAREPVTTVLEELGESLLEHPRLLQALLGPALATLQRTAAGYISRIPSRLRRRLLGLSRVKGPASHGS
jgi:hypothetical protein